MRAEQSEDMANAKMSCLLYSGGLKGREGLSDFQPTECLLPELTLLKGLVMTHSLPMNYDYTGDNRPFSSLIPKTVSNMARSRRSTARSGSMSEPTRSIAGSVASEICEPKAAIAPS